MVMDTSELKYPVESRLDVVRWLIPDRVILGEGKITRAVRKCINARIIYLMHSNLPEWDLSRPDLAPNAEGSQA